MFLVFRICVKRGLLWVLFCCVSTYSVWIHSECYSPSRKSLDCVSVQIEARLPTSRWSPWKQSHKCKMLHHYDDLDQIRVASWKTYFISCKMHSLFQHTAVLGFPSMYNMLLLGNADNDFVSEYFVCAFLPWGYVWPRTRQINSLSIQISNFDFSPSELMWRHRIG